jgi:hypothetical protein
MKVPRMQTARHTALLILINIAHYSEQKSRPVHRARFSENAIRRMSRRQRLKEAFIQDLSEELLNLEWCFFCLPDGNGYGIVRVTATDSWAGLGTKRLSEEGFCDMTEQELESELENLLNNDEE